MEVEGRLLEVMDGAFAVVVGGCIGRGGCSRPYIKQDVQADRVPPTTAARSSAGRSLGHLTGLLGQADSYVINPVLSGHRALT